MSCNSNLRRRVISLSAIERVKLLRQIERLHAESQKFKSDDCDFFFPTLKTTANARQDSALVTAIVHDYHNCKKSIPTIIVERQITDFVVISSLCGYVITEMGAFSHCLDFTEAIRYMNIEQASVIALVNRLLDVEGIKFGQIIADLLGLPSTCLMWMTLIWIELKWPDMADTFDQNWHKMEYVMLTEEDFKELDEEIEEAFSFYSDVITTTNSNIIRQIDDRTKVVHEILDERTKVINDINNTMKELQDTLNARPSLECENVVSDSSESAQEENDEISVLMQQINVRWMQTTLTHENLDSEIVIIPMENYFCKAATFLEGNRVMETFVMCRLIGRIENEFNVQLTATNQNRTINANELAMGRPPNVRCPEGTRIIALYTRRAGTRHSAGAGDANEESSGYWLAGTVGVKPLIQNNFEYLVFFDNGIDDYVASRNIRLIIGQSFDATTKRFEPRLAYTQVRNVEKQTFVKKYLQANRDGREESAFVLDVDRQMCLLRFPNQRIGFAMKMDRDCVVLNCKEHEHVDEWIYRGNSTRFPTLLNSAGPADKRSSARRLGRTRSRFEIAQPEYDSTIQQKLATIGASRTHSSHVRGLQTARKSGKRQVLETAASVANIPEVDEDLITRRKLSNKLKFDTLTPPDWRHLKYVPHKQCSPRCIKHVESKLELSAFSPCSPYFIPQIYGWTRELRKVKSYGGRSENVRTIVVYRAPCGIRFTKTADLANYLRVTRTENLTIDLFSFDVNVRANLIARPFKPDWILMDDFARGYEDVKIPVVNAVNDEKVPSMTYRARRYADLSVIDRSVQPQFCSGCSCTDDCSDPYKCECQQLTIISNDRLSTSLRVTGAKTYRYRSLSEKVISGLYECNDMCLCSKKLCYNRVVQQNIKIPLLLYMTAETGWGVRTLVDIPAGTFISTYSGRLLTDRMAEMQGREMSDMYLAELDLHEVVEAEKQQQGIDLIDADYDEGIGTANEDDEQANTSEQQQQMDTTEAGSSSVVKNDPTDEPPKTRPLNAIERANEFNFDTYFGDNALFIVDALESGNIGRFLNHSCEPNVYVQMVMVDTHDLRLPWVCFFAETFVKAGEELRWNYGYSPNSVPGKVLICKCGSQHCQGRLL